MTTVDINEKWRIQIDELNHTLERFNEGGVVIPNGKYKGQLTKATWEVVGYYPNLLQCLRAVVRVEATAIPETDLNSYITRLERLNEEIKL